MQVQRRARAAELARVLEKRERAERDHVRGGLVPSHQQQYGHLRHVIVDQFTGPDPSGEQGEHAVVRFGQLPADELVEVVGQAGAKGFPLLLAGARSDQDFAFFLEEGDGLLSALTNKTLVSVGRGPWCQRLVKTDPVRARGILIEQAS
ncbi:hypothetical protein [Actinospica robiniae]|uniref:hypothetical protein n=1 Tax=Actinospica robiniae TaxID=304901 RepID=UPI0012F749C0|nr:hypothetical protein [Actinospica robiniae]